MSKMEASVTKKPGTKRRDSQPDVISHSPSISDGEIGEPDNGEIARSLVKALKQMQTVTLYLRRS